MVAGGRDGIEGAAGDGMRGAAIATAVPVRGRGEGAGAAGEGMRGAGERIAGAGEGGDGVEGEEIAGAAGDGMRGEGESAGWERIEGEGIAGAGESGDGIEGEESEGAAVATAAPVLFGWGAGEAAGGDGGAARGGAVAHP